MAHWNPASRFLSKMHPQSSVGKIVDSELLSHIEKHDSIVLVSFGVTFPMPDLLNLIKALSMDESIGVIINPKHP